LRVYFFSIVSFYSVLGRIRLKTLYTYTSYTGVLKIDRAFLFACRGFF
jgi:hypothetical protein